MHKEVKDCRCTTDAPCPSRNEPLTMVGPEYRQMAHPEHVEFAPTHARAEPYPEGWTRIDGLKFLPDMDRYVVSKLYRKYVGTLDSGEEIYFVGEYVGNRRVNMDNDPDPAVVGTTWQIFLQEDKELDTPIECYRLCDLEVVEGSGTHVVEANDYNPKRPKVKVYEAEEAPPKPELRLAVDHPYHGGGEVVRVTGTGDVWYAAVQYGWDSVENPPPLAVSVRRLIEADNGREYYVYGEVVDVDEGFVTVEYENGREHRSSTRDFYRIYSKIVETGSEHFHEVFGLPQPYRRPTVRTRRIGPDPRTTNERAFGAYSRSATAFSALVDANTPDSGHFVPDSRNSTYLGSGFRWHRSRPVGPKYDDFAPLMGRPEKVPRPKKGWSYDRLNKVREELALTPGAPEPKALPEARRPRSMFEEEVDTEYKPTEISDAEFEEFHGKTVLF